MNKIVLAFFLTLFSLSGYADGGDPTIQAVCRVTLDNGEIVEGFITIGYGGYYGIWSNGFYFEQGANYKHPILFSLAFKSVKKTKKNSYAVNIGVGGGLSFQENKKFHFMQWEKTPSVYKPKNIEIHQQDSCSFLSVTTKLEKKYKLFDSLTVFLELPSTTYLSSKEDVSKVSIALSKIEKFELLSNPTEKWISEIKNKTVKAHELHNGPESTGDFWESSWYHDILLNEILYNRYQQMIEYNNKR